jgi:hypothetical protein
LIWSIVAVHYSATVFAVGQRLFFTAATAQAFGWTGAGAAVLDCPRDRSPFISISVRAGAEKSLSRQEKYMATFATAVFSVRY